MYLKSENKMVCCKKYIPELEETCGDARYNIYANLISIGQSVFSRQLRIRKNAYTKMCFRTASLTAEKMNVFNKSVCTKNPNK